MDTLMDIFGLPTLLAIALFIGIVILVRQLLSPNGMMERRRSRRDRRRVQSMPSVPFYDSERILVTQDRRGAADRRKRTFMIITEHKRA